MNKKVVLGIFSVVGLGLVAYGVMQYRKNKGLGGAASDDELQRRGVSFYDIRLEPNSGGKLAK